jgi:2-(1,2-epoxy-1,2-dihydrophenyl)acetyl-CoA isomerase
METKTDYNLVCNTFSAEKIEDIILLRFKDNFLLHSTDLSVRDRILDYLSLVEKSDLIKAIVIIGSPEKRGCDEYFDCYRQILKSEQGINAVFRMYNVINQLILKLVQLNKFVIHGNSGKIISSFFNISLACDYRILADNAVFQNPCLELGLLPKGGGAFFLPKIIGLAKAYDLLLSEKNIYANDALELGIVNKVVPLNELEDAAIETATYFGQKPASSLAGIKHLINYSLKDLEDYLDIENQTLIKALNSSGEWGPV